VIPVMLTVILIFLIAQGERIPWQIPVMAAVLALLFHGLIFLGICWTHCKGGIFMINWKVRIKNKQFWLALIPAILLLIQVTLSIFGVTFDFGEIGNKLAAFVNAVFAVLTILGIVTDPTTDGVGDSQRALTYQTPYKDFIEED